MTDQVMDAAALAAWMDGQGLGEGPIGEIERLAGGTQNIVVRFRRGDRWFVLRRPSLTPRPSSNSTMLREARLLAALAGSAVPHPRLLASCEVPGVLGCTFYLMDCVEGFNPTVQMPPAALADASVRHRMGCELGDALAALALLDPEQLGLGDFGKAEGWLERQVGRWRAEFESYARFDAWTGHRDFPGLDAAGAWLERNRPESQWTGIIHGDYHIGNALFGPDGANRAVVDWEMATLGDPLLDLARLLLSWPQNGQAQVYTMRVSPLDGFPQPAELVSRYGAATGCDLGRLPWFEVLARYKLGIILEGSHARAQGGQVDRATGERLHRSAVALIADIGQRIAGG